MHAMAASPTSSVSSSARPSHLSSAATSTHKDARSLDSDMETDNSSPFSLASTITVCGGLDADIEKVPMDDASGDADAGAIFLSNKGSCERETETQSNLIFSEHIEDLDMMDQEINVSSAMVDTYPLTEDVHALGRASPAPSDAFSVQTLTDERVEALDGDTGGNALELDGVSSTALSTLSVDIPCGTHVDQRGRSTSPLESASSAISVADSIASSVSSEPSSSASSIHSSFSATQKQGSATSGTHALTSSSLASVSLAAAATESITASVAVATNKAPPPGQAIRNIPKRLRHPSSRATGDVAPLRPLGPAHLEHDYSRARHELSTAVAIAAYDLYQFALPLRSTASEARRPSNVDIPKLREHPAVQKAAKMVDKADMALEEALKRGQTWENTEVPACWRWNSGDEKLKEVMDWAYLEPETRPLKRRRGRKTRAEIRAEMEAETKARLEMGLPVEVGVEEGVIRTRGQKRRAPVDDDEDARDSGGEAADEEDEGDDDHSACEEEVRDRKSTSVQRTVSGSKPRGRPPISRNASTASAPARVASSSKTLSPALSGKKRGRPRKHPLPEQELDKNHQSSALGSRSRVVSKDKYDSSASSSPARASKKLKEAEDTPSSQLQRRLDPEGLQAISVLEAGENVPTKRPRGRPRKYALPGTVIVNGYCVPITPLISSQPNDATRPSSAEPDVSESQDEESEELQDAREKEKVLRERKEFDDPNARRSKRAKIDVSYRE